MKTAEALAARLPRLFVVSFGTGTCNGVTTADHAAYLSSLAGRSGGPNPKAVRVANLFGDLARGSFMDLVAALAPDRDVVCAVGAGGKKSTLYALADRLDRAVVTATVRIPIFDQHVARVEVTEDPVAALRTAGPDEWPLGLVPERERSDRYLGYDPGTVDTIAAADVAEAVLVKADGARMREFKAPGEREPQLPEQADVVVPVASVQVVGEPLGEAHVHRPERVAAITGLAEGDEIRPRHVADVLASTDGGRKDVPDGATVRPVVNKVDDESWEPTARAVAERVIDSADVAGVVLASMTSEAPLVDVVD